MSQLTIELNRQTEQTLRSRATDQGVTLEMYVARLAERDATSPRRTFEQIVGPISEAIAEAGMSDEQIGDFFEQQIREVRADRRASRNVP